MLRFHVPPLHLAYASESKNLPSPVEIDSPSEFERSNSVPLKSKGTVLGSRSASASRHLSDCHAFAADLLVLPAAKHQLGVCAAGHQLHPQALHRPAWRIAAVYNVVMATSSVHPNRGASPRTPNMSSRVPPRMPGHLTERPLASRRAHAHAPRTPCDIHTRPTRIGVADRR